LHVRGSVPSGLARFRTERSREAAQQTAWTRRTDADGTDRLRRRATRTRNRGLHRQPDVEEAALTLDLVTALDRSEQSPAIGFLLRPLQLAAFESDEHMDGRDHQREPN